MGETSAHFVKALLLRNLAGSTHFQHDAATATQDAPPPQPAYLRKKSLGSDVKAKVGRLVVICRQNNIQLSGNPYQVINKAWGRVVGYSREATNDETERKLKWLDSLITRAIAGDKSIALELS